jgi:hypothetical protein
MSEQLLIIHKRIDLSASPILYDRPLSQEAFGEDWEVCSGQWQYLDGAFVGRNDRPQPGCVVCRKSFPCNVLMDFHARTIAPCTHDIDVMWNMSWDEAKDARGPAYVAGIQGWWDGKVGIERSPEYKLIAAAPSPWFRPGQEYHVQAGSIDGHCFLFVDGQLRLELLDPDPIDFTKHDRVGFEAYQSMVRISRLVVRRIAWEPRQQSYPKEF